MTGSAKVSLEERWAALPGMPEVIASLVTYEEELLSREVAEDTGDEAVRDSRLAVVMFLRAGLAAFEPALMSPPLITALATAIQSARNELVNYGWTSQGNEHGLTELTRQIVVPGRGSSVASLTDSVKELHALETEMKEAVASATSSMEELQQARTSFDEEVQGAIDAGEDTISGATTKLVEDGARKIGEKLAEAEADRAAAAQAFKEAHDAAEGVLGEMREKLSIATDTALSHDYSKAAAAEGGEGRFDAPDLDRVRRHYWLDRCGGCRSPGRHSKLGRSLGVGHLTRARQARCGCGVRHDRRVAGPRVASTSGRVEPATPNGTSAAKSRIVPCRA